ncbi:hypothetical protein FHW88_000265 [Mucilaginibacter sp. SG538B]|nr:hypothetical protein [Mucilaginibacter sp. SG538B]NVM61989.1 hypothetical protein [Mucilaginibacter sp. SG538B]
MPKINVRKAINANDKDSELSAIFDERNFCKVGAIRSINKGIICIAVG